MANILVVGTGTIGFPIIKILSKFKKQFGINKIYFYKHSNKEKSKVDLLLSDGNILVCGDKNISYFQSFGYDPIILDNALKDINVVIDCSSTGGGIKNKELYYNDANNVSGFIAQGSEHGFGSIYIKDISENNLDRFTQIASCNTHSISSVLNQFVGDNIVSADIVCIRRSSDVSQPESIASVQVGQSKDDVFGTHHAKDAFMVLGHKIPNARLFSSALKVNSQYTHTIRFSINTTADLGLNDVISRLTCQNISFTNILNSCEIFSFGRDNGLCGRILNQSIVILPTVSVSKTTSGTTITGMCWTPQDGNSLLSSISACLYYIDPTTLSQKMKVFDPYLFNLI